MKRHQMGSFPADVVAALRSEEGRRAWRETMSAICLPDFDGAMCAPNVHAEFDGLDGFFAIWADWVKPFASYRVEFERVIDAGGSVVIYVRQFGRPRGSAAEVEQASASVSFFRGERISRIEYHLNREDALRAAGLDPAQVGT